jgi:protein FAM32A
MKTHKERVEELNRYLSNLSEHHDMWVVLLVLEYALLTQAD